MTESTPTAAWNARFAGMSMTRQKAMNTGRFRQIPLSMICPRTGAVRSAMAAKTIFCCSMTNQPIHQRLEQTFNAILQQRMADVALINPKLKVQAVGFQLFRSDWIGILITPWFMNLLLLPSQPEDWPAFNNGDSISRQFPQGEFHFILNNEQSLGAYASCSLYSPMFQFQQQEVAVATANAALQGLFVEHDSPESQKPANISRRDLLRGKFKRDR